MNCLMRSTVTLSNPSPRQRAGTEDALVNFKARLTHGFTTNPRNSGVSFDAATFVKHGALSLAGVHVTSPFGRATAVGFRIFRQLA
jgi:hypothetical protein